MVVYRPLNLLICLRCRGAIPPASLKKHWKTSSYHDADEHIKITERDIVDLTEKYALFKDNILSDNQTFQVPIPGITYFEAFVCEARGCNVVTRSEPIARRHRASHGYYYRDDLQTSSVHQVFITNQKMYRIKSVPKVLDTEKSVPANAAPNNSSLAILLHEQEGRLDALNRTDMPGESTNPFLQKYRWKEEVEKLSPETIMALVAHPDLSDPLSTIPRQLTLYYEPIVKEMKRLDTHITTLRWVRSTKRYVALSECLCPAPDTALDAAQSSTDPSRSLFVLTPRIVTFERFRVF